MDRALHLVAVKVIGSSQDDGAGGPGLGALHQDELIITDSLLGNLSSFSQHASLETFLSFNVSKTGDKRSSSSLGNPLEILLLSPPDTKNLCTLLFKSSSSSINLFVFN